MKLDVAVYSHLEPFPRRFIEYSRQILLASDSCKNAQFYHHSGRTIQHKDVRFYVERFSFEIFFYLKRKSFYVRSR